MAKIETTKISGNDYAKVALRLAEFRKTNPRAKITTKPVPQPDGGLIFYTSILKDKADEFSAEATGSAFYSANKMRIEKAFEKLETISVGRALALLGYLNNGEIATSEEMEEFENYKKDKDGAEDFIEEIKKAENLAELQKLYIESAKKFKDSPHMAKIIEAKNAKKEELCKN